MGQNDSIFNKIHYKVNAVKANLRKAYYKANGMVIGNHTHLGEIRAESPGSVEIGQHCTIRNFTTFWIQSPFKVANRITIGNHVFIGQSVEFNCCDQISIGDNCLIASSTIFVDSSHSYDGESLIAGQPLKMASINLEEGVWVGSNCKILYGVNLGKGCIIGAGAVVNKSVPPFEIWAGVPARKIGERRPNK